MADPERRPTDSAAVNGPGSSTFQTVLTPATMAPHLRSVLPDRCESARVIRIHILKRHRTRCTFVIEWPVGNEQRAVIGKVYEADRADVYRIMDAIRRAGFGADQPFSIPEPLAYIPELRLLLLEMVPGVRVKQVLLTGAEADRDQAIERCAHWLARFHAVAPRLGRPYRVDDVLASLDEWSQPFGAAGDLLAARANRLHRQLAAAAGRLESTEPCAGHGHYTCGQVLMVDTAAIESAARGSASGEVPAKDRTVAFDWDDPEVADPSHDLASFLVNLKRHAWETPASSAALGRGAERFLNTYFSTARSDAGANLPFYVAADCFRLASREMVKHGPANAAVLLEEGLRGVERPRWSWDAYS